MRIVMAALIVFATSGAASANDAPDPAAADAFFNGLVQEEDIGLFFGYLHHALEAAAEGRELPPPAALTERAEAIGGEAKRRGVVAGGVLLDALERSVREILSRPPRLRAVAPSASARLERF